VDEDGEVGERGGAACALHGARRVLLIPRHASVCVDATAVVILSFEPAKHAAGALFGLALAEDNRAAICVLGAVPPLLSSSPLPPNTRARRDAGMRSRRSI
jgi:hypothetical protein